MKNQIVKTLFLKDDGIIPNHPELPVLLYVGALSHKAKDTEDIFNRNGWLNSWKNGVFSYHHYHSNSHEVLGVISGSAIIQLGGEQGTAFSLYTGDVVVLPAGTGHKKLSSSDDFLVVGAYPDGMEYNTRLGDISERSQALKEISNVPLPVSDPVYGTDGPLIREWQMISQRPTSQEEAHWSE